MDVQGRRGLGGARLERLAKLAERCRFPASSFVVPMRRQWGRLTQGGRRCGLWCSGKPLRTAKGRPPHARAAGGVRGDGPVHRGAGQGRRIRGRRRPQEQRPGQAHRLRWSRPHGHRRAVRREPRAGRRLLDWEVKDMDEAMAWAKRSPNLMPGKKSEIEIRPFYEAAESGRVRDARGARGAP